MLTFAQSSYTTHEEIHLRRVIKVFGLVALVIVGLFFVLAWKFKTSLEPSSDIGDYQSALETVQPELVEHFPKVTPAVTQSRFYYRPGFLQGGTIIHLLLKSGAAGTRSALEKYEAKALERYRGCSRKEPSAELMPRIQRSDAKEDAACDFVMLVLRASPTEEWNHRYESGIAISEKRNEVLYWVEVW